MSNRLNKKEIVDGFPAYTRSIGLEPEDADTVILGDYIVDIATSGIIDDEDLEILNDADEEIRIKYNLSEPEIWDEDLYENKKLEDDEELEIERIKKALDKDAIFPDDVFYSEGVALVTITGLRGTHTHTDEVMEELGYRFLEDEIINEDDDTYTSVKHYVNDKYDGKFESKKVEVKFKDKVKAIKENDKRLSDETAQNTYEFKAGYYEWQLLKNGKVIAVFNDFVDELPDKCTKENLRDFIDNYLLVPRFGNEEDSENNQEFNEAIEGVDRETIIKVILNKLYYEYGDLEESKKVEAKFKDKVKAIKKSLKENDKRLSDETAQKSAERIAGSMIKNESIRDGGKPNIDLYIRQINEIADNLGISKNEIQKEGDSIKFRYNGKVYFAEPRAMYQVDIFDDKHKQIGWGVLTNEIKEEVFTDYITDNKFVYELVGGDKAGNYTKEQLDSLGIIDGNTGENLGRRDELKNQPTLKGYLGPMWNGTKDGKAIIRYETQEVYDQLSESKKLNEIASKVPGTEVEKKPVIEYEEFYSGEDLDNLGSDAELIYDMYEKLGIDIDEAWDIVEDDMDSGVLKIAHINGNSYLVYDDGETQAYCIGRASDNMPITIIGNIEDDTEIMKPVKRDTTELDNIYNSLYGDELNESKKLQEDEVIDRPEDIAEEQNEEIEDETEKDIEETTENRTILDLLEERIGQELEAGRLNAVLQSIFGMYNRTFILPTDLYNVDADEEQTLTVFDDGDEYNIYYDVIDIEGGLIKITGVEIL